MGRFPAWKHAIVAALIVTGVLYALPSAYPQSPTLHIRATATGSDKNLLQKTKRALEAENVPVKRLEQKDDSVIVTFNDADNQISGRASIANALGRNYVVALNTATDTPGWLRGIGASPIALGLDLRGGVYFLLRVDLQYAEQRRLSGLFDEIQRPLRQLGAGDIRLEGAEIIVETSNPDTAERLYAEIQENYELLELPNDPATVMRLPLVDSVRQEIADLTMEQNLQTLRNRVDELGVAEPVITRQGNDRIVVQLPGLQDPAQAKNILGRTAALELRGVDEAKSNSTSVLRRAKKGRAPTGTELFNTRDGVPLLLSKGIIVKGENITDARPGYDNNNQPAVHISLDGSGANKMKKFTRSRVGERLAILLRDNDNAEIISAPVVREELFANFMISGGNMRPDEAAELSLLLRAGALAAPLEIIEERTVGPSLGADNIRRGLNSVSGGFLAIALFIIFYYAVFGAISVAALLVNVVLLTAMLGLVGATLTLPGLAGFALTLGMAIDANVLINERIREEYDSGQTPLASIHAGYERAFTTILDANITTLIAGVALFAFGSGPVRGFAVVLCFGLLTSMFSAVLASRSMVNGAIERRRVNKLLLGLRALNLKRVLSLVKWRRLTGGLSFIFLLICIISLAVRGLNFGVDFTGGTITEVAFQQAPQPAQVRAQVESVGLDNALIQISDDGLVLIKASSEAGDADLSSSLLTALREIDTNAVLQRVEYVGPQVGDELFIAGALALVCVLLGIAIYLSFRFKWRMAIGAITANFHDVVFILGLFSLFQWEFSLPVLAAILAILGYSVNESVVIFDRVRENFRKQRRDESTPERVLDTAITQTWARTIITHGSTQLAVLAMLFFGGDALYLFALALTIGIFSSIYSSVLIAGPTALALGMARDDFIEAEKTKADNPAGAVV